MESWTKQFYLLQLSTKTTYDCAKQQLTVTKLSSENYSASLNNIESIKLKTCLNPNNVKANQLKRGRQEIKVNFGGQKPLLSHFCIQLPFLQQVCMRSDSRKDYLYHQILVTKTAILLRFNSILKRMVELCEQSIMEMQGQTNPLCELRFLSNQYNLADESFSGNISVSQFQSIKFKRKSGTQRFSHQVVERNFLLGIQIRLST